MCNVLAFNSLKHQLLHISLVTQKNSLSVFEDVPTKKCDGLRILPSNYVSNKIIEVHTLQIVVHYSLIRFFLIEKCKYIFTILTILHN